MINLNNMTPERKLIEIAFKINTKGKTKEEIDKLIAYEEHAAIKELGCVEVDTREEEGHTILICRL